MAQTKAERTAAAKKAAQTRAAKKAAEEGQQNTGSETSDDGQEAAPEVDQSSRVGARHQMLQHQSSHPELENAGLDQHGAEAKRQAELQAERDEHNRRTGDASRT